MELSLKNFFLIIILFDFFSCKIENKSIPETNSLNIPPYAISGNMVNLRIEPEIKSKVIKRLNHSESVEILEINRPKFSIYLENENKYLDGDWFKVKLNDGTIGWVYNKYVSLNFGSKGNSNIIFLEISKNNNYIANVFATLNDGVLKEISYKTGEPLIPKTEKNENIILYDKLGNTIGESKINKIIKIGQKYLCNTCYKIQGEFKHLKNIETAYFGIAGAFLKSKTSNLKLNITELSPNEKDLIISDSHKYFVKELNTKNDYFGETMDCNINDRCRFEKLFINDTKTLFISTLKTYKKNETPIENDRPKTIFRVDSIDSGKLSNFIITDHLVGGDGTESEYYSTITDLDGNGIYELWTQTLGWESGGITIYSIEDKRIIKIFGGNSGY